MEQEMNGKRLLAACALLCFCVFAAALIVESHPAQEKHEAVEHECLPKSTRMSSIFDFANYKLLFKKTYASFLEEMNRKRDFFARALRVFISAVNYKHAKQPYYLAINHFSDATPEELDRMRNRVLDKEFVASLGGENDKVRTEEPALDDVDPGDNIEANLRELVEDNPDEPVMKELDEFLAGNGESPRRKKRSTEGDRTRQLTLAKLISSSQAGQLESEVEAEVGNGAKSANSKRRCRFVKEMVKVDIRSPGSSTPYKVGKFSREVKKKVVHSLNTIFSDSDSDSDAENEPQLPDEVFFDLRTESKCFLPPRHQAMCGSCYAFATIAMAEWLYCMKTGRLVAFSEQYMIDCGNDFVPGLDGCDGGQQFSAARFVHNFGLELRSDYPYNASTNSCPYDKDKPLRTTGAIRMQIDLLDTMPLRKFAKLIQRGPIFLVIATDNTFTSYGGGVHGVKCTAGWDETHSVVLVGHGRENGREYWLVRNSFGPNWGEAGYYKLDKEADGICNRLGYMYITKKGLSFSSDMDINQDNQFGPVSLQSEVE